MALKILSGPLHLGGGGGGLQVKTSSTLDPKTITGLQFWIKADAGTSTTTDGVALATWSDQSGNARDATQGTAGQRPTFKTNIAGTKPGILFASASGQRMATAAFTLAQAQTMFVVCTETSGAGTKSPFCLNSNGRIYIDTTGFWAYSAGTAQVTATARNTSIHCVSAVFNGASSALFLDGASISTANPNTGGATVGAVIGDNPDNTGRWSGYVFECLAYSGSLSTANRQAIEAYLKTRWGTP